jgi:hypothetical protein
MTRIIRVYNGPCAKLCTLANKKGDYTMEGQILGKITKEKDIRVLKTGDLATSVLLRQIQKNFTYRDRFT